MRRTSSYGRNDREMSCDIQGSGSGTTHGNGSEQKNVKGQQVDATRAAAAHAIPSANAATAAAAAAAPAPPPPPPQQQQLQQQLPPRRQRQQPPSKRRIILLAPQSLSSPRLRSRLGRTPQPPAWRSRVQVAPPRRKIMVRASMRTEMPMVEQMDGAVADRMIQGMLAMSTTTSDWEARDHPRNVSRAQMPATRRRQTQRACPLGQSKTRHHPRRVPPTSCGQVPTATAVETETEVDLMVALAMAQAH